MLNNTDAINSAVSYARKNGIDVFNYIKMMNEQKYRIINTTSGREVKLVDTKSLSDKSMDHDELPMFVDSWAFTQSNKSLIPLEKTNTKIRKMSSNKIDYGKAGRDWEQAICRANGIEYKHNNTNTNYKDLMIDDARIQKMIKSTGKTYIHSADLKATYDFVSTCGTGLSAKTSLKTNGTLCPHTIGQIPIPNFKRVFKLSETATDDDVKQYIVDNLPVLLQAYCNKTFDAPIAQLLRTSTSDIISLITLVTPINWDDKVFSYTCCFDEWKQQGSTTVKILTPSNKYESIIAITVYPKVKGKSHSNQVHASWKLENLIKVFKDNFDVKQF